MRVAAIIILLSALLTACETAPVKHLQIVPHGNGQVAASVLFDAELQPSACRQSSRCEFSLKVTNKSDKPVSLSISDVTATANGRSVAVITPQQLLTEFQADTTESLTAQQFSAPPPRGINDQSLSQRQLAESGRTAASRLEEQLARMRYLKKITSQMLDKTSIGPATSYTGLVVLDLSGVEAGQIIRVHLSVAATTLELSFSAQTKAVK